MDLDGVVGVPTTRWTLVTRAELLLCVLVVGFASVLLALAFGRDLNWDFFNYHLYSGLLLWQGRITQDFMAAGYQGYMNPLPYLPLYLMTAAKWHSMVIASVIALVQSLNFVFLYLISRQVVGADPYPRLAATVTTALGACSVVVLGQLGSSFIDLSTAWPVLAAVWLLLLPKSAGRLLLIGGLVGIATGLKLTNIVFAFGVLAAVVWQQRAEWAQGMRNLVMWSAGAVMGLLLVYGYWGVQLQQHFGSPVFPMFNQIFKAPDFAEVPIQNNRFLPGSIGELLSLPVRMLELKGWIYVENQAPDLRPLVLLVLLACLCVASPFAKLRQRANPTARHSHSEGVDTKSVGLFGMISCFMVASLIAWVPTSSNGRYAAPILMLLGPLIYMSVRRLAAAKFTLVFCAALLGLQAAHVSHAGNPHWSPNLWAKEWLPADIPMFLREKPHLILSIGKSSESYVAAYVHPDSVIVNPIGLISIASDGPGWNRLQALINEHRGRIQVIFPAPFSNASGEGKSDRASYLASRNMLVDRIGIGFDPDSCETLSFNVLPPDWTSPETGRAPYPRKLVSCSAERLTRRSPELAVARGRAERIMNAIEDRCPAIFGPSRPQAEGLGDLWVRLYGKYDISLAVNLATTEVFFRMEHQNVDSVIGHVGTIEADIDKFECGLPRSGKRGL